MIELARNPNRADLFRAVAQKRRVHEAIIEKDFWVCWTLDYLFSVSPWKDRMVFKGGTSLSKAFGLIQRFSEDIDLVLDWTLLGFDPNEPWGDRSLTKQDTLNKSANQRAAEFLVNTFLPRFASDNSVRLGSPIDARVEGQELLFRYPKAFSLEAIRPEIRLEIGPLAAWVPNEVCEVRSFVAEDFPGLFMHPSCRVSTVSAKRTFWEKATILHQEAHRAPEKPIPLWYSRHYYDLFRMVGSAVESQALDDLPLLRDVVQFKERFYRSNWAKYDLAKPGTFRLVPERVHVVQLERDYASMRAMIFGPYPPFGEIIESLAGLEGRVNGS